MKSIDQIIVTVDVLLSLDIAGLPTTDYAMRRHARKNNWPHAFDDKGKYLYFIEAIPPPFGDTIREKLKAPLPPAPSPTVLPDIGEPRLEEALIPRMIMEARLLLLFEVFRRSSYKECTYAMRSLAEDARTGQLSEVLQQAVRQAVLNARGEAMVWRDENGPIPHPIRCKGYALVVDEKARRRAERAALKGTLTKTGSGEFLDLSFSTLSRWMSKFNNEGAYGLLPRP